MSVNQEQAWDGLYSHERHMLWMMEQDAKHEENLGRHSNATVIRERIECYRRQYVMLSREGR